MAYESTQKNNVNLKCETSSKMRSNLHGTIEGEEIKMKVQGDILRNMFLSNTCISIVSYNSSRISKSHIL